MMERGSRGLILLAAIVVAVQTQECHQIVPLVECEKDQGPIEPVDGQPVYLGSTNGRGWWRYPTADGWVRHYEHDTRTIMETEHSWAKWIYHDCGGGYVCLESGKYPNYYFYGTTSGLQGISYSAAPETEDWARQKVTSKNVEPRGLYMFFVSERFYKDGYRRGLPVYIYVPPRCEGFRKVADYTNRSPVSIDYKYTYERGITRSEKSSTTTEIKSEISVEVVISIITASRSGSFTQTWSNEKATAQAEKQTHQSSIKIPRDKRLIIWQKVVTYGPYEWRSGVSFVTCMTDV